LEETPLEAGRRALSQELGIQTDLREVTRFIYLAHDPESGYTEQEYDHVLIGFWDGNVYPNPSEVSAARWLEPEDLAQEIASDPEAFAYWFRQILQELKELNSANGILWPQLSTFVKRLDP
jgi:isopentenyl-diphosphate delta-isomerase